MPFAVYVLGLLIFAQTTSEFMVAGMMPTLSEEFGVSISPSATLYQHMQLVWSSVVRY